MEKNLMKVHGGKSWFVRIRRFVPAAVLLLIPFFVVSCSWSEARLNRKKLEQVRIGMSKAEVKALMGEPLANEKYSTPDIWFYYTDPQWYDGMYTRDECTPLLFDRDGILRGMGYRFYKEKLNESEWTRRVLDPQL